MSNQTLFLSDNDGPDALVFTGRTQVHVPFSFSITRTGDPVLEPVATLISMPDISCKRTPHRRLSGPGKGIFQVRKNHSKCW